MAKFDLEFWISNSTFSIEFWIIFRAQFKICLSTSISDNRNIMYCKFIPNADVLCLICQLIRTGPVVRVDCSSHSREVLSTAVWSQICIKARYLGDLMFSISSRISFINTGEWVIIKSNLWGNVNFISEIYFAKLLVYFVLLILLFCNLIFLKQVNDLKNLAFSWAQACHLTSLQIHCQVWILSLLISDIHL